ncbi:MAG: AAA family ATPase [Candidatus Micrarchaeaceae archaeon]
MTRADPRLWRLVAGGETGPAGNGGGLTFVLLLEFLQTGGGAGERWIWDGYIGHGHVVLLCGAPKSGKTTLVSHLSVAVATGTPFLGRPVEKCPVLWLGLEEARTTVQRRFSQLVAQSPDIPLYVHVGPLPPGVSLEDVIADLREKIAYYRVGLAIIDTLAFFWRLPDENDSSLVIRHISPLLALARETEVGLLLLHHLRKSPGDAGADIRGSSALFASVDVALILRRDGYSPTRRILEAHSRFDETPARLVLDYDLSVPAWRCLGGAEEVRRQDVQEEILGVLSDEPQTTNEIAEAIDRRKADVIRALKELLDMGCVRRDGTGRRGDPARWTLAR